MLLKLFFSLFFKLCITDTTTEALGSSVLATASSNVNHTTNELLRRASSSSRSKTSKESRKSHNQLPRILIEELHQLLQANNGCMFVDTLSSEYKVYMLCRAVVVVVVVEVVEVVIQALYGSITTRRKYMGISSMDCRERGSHARGVYLTQDTSRMRTTRVK